MNGRRGCALSDAWGGLRGQEFMALGLYLVFIVVRVVRSDMGICPNRLKLDFFFGFNLGWCVSPI